MSSPGMTSVGRRPRSARAPAVIPAGRWTAADRAAASAVSCPPDSRLAASLWRPTRMRGAAGTSARALTGRRTGVFAQTGPRGAAAASTPRGGRSASAAAVASGPRTESTTTKSSDATSRICAGVRFTWVLVVGGRRGAEHGDGCCPHGSTGGTAREGVVIEKGSRRPPAAGPPVARPDQSVAARRESDRCPRVSRAGAGPESQPEDDTDDDKNISETGDGGPRQADVS